MKYTSTLTTVLCYFKTDRDTELSQPMIADKKRDHGNTIGQIK